MNDREKFIGKYRGTVVNNVDPELRGRLLVQVPDALGPIPSSWAEPCVPLAGPTGPPMGVYMVPPIGAGVWVEFEHGDIDYPIWVGCRWGAQSDVPPLAHAGIPATPNIVFQTTTQHALVMSDTPGPTGGILLKTATGAMISVSDVGITISNGKGAIINMTGTAIDITGTPVNINAGALTIT
ncbi:MAG: baseplate assembly protein [Gammaproteobacteria bacterium]|nr:baseplate assembly protein [Gammaproteobacteria bacterium]